MKKLFEKIGRTVVACLLLTVGLSVHAESSWTGGSSSITVSKTDWNKIGTTPVYIKGSSLSYATNYKGYCVPDGTVAYMKVETETPSTLTISAKSVGSSDAWRTITIEESTTGFSLATVVASTTSGDVTDITFDVESGLEYSLENKMKNATTGKANTFYITKVVLSVAGQDYILLDEETSRSENESLISGSTATNKKKVKLHRTLKAGQWNTFCLPITIPANSLQTQLKCSAAYKLTGYDEASGEVTFSAIEASNNTNCYRNNTPCLIMPTEDLVDPILTGTTDATVNASTLTTTVNGLSFIGIYGYEDIYTTGDGNSTKFYLNNSGKLVYPTSNTGNNGKIKGLRAYFELPNGASVKDLTFNFDDDATGIRKVEKDIFGEQGSIYTLDGRFAGHSADNLPQGLYIRNGRKFIVK
ncbi:MAG: hypothetical protein IJ148_08425 [Bacteroidaceae bacterium]|nr:hypothetical protein [Bacteroidaceae bacterium]